MAHRLTVTMTNALAAFASPTVAQEAARAARQWARAGALRLAVVSGTTLSMVADPRNGARRGLAHDRGHLRVQRLGVRCFRPQIQVTSC